MKRRRKIPDQLFLTVDPGVNIGWALWDWTEPTWGRCVPPLNAGSFTVRCLPGWRDRFADTAGRFDRELRGRWPNLTGAAIEWPFGVGGGSNDEDILKLQFTVGWLACIIQQVWGVRTDILPVTTWKGQMSKELTDKRIAKRLGQDVLDGLDSHARDAVGMGLHLKGFSFG